MFIEQSNWLRPITVPITEPITLRPAERILSNFHWATLYIPV